MNTAGHYRSLLSLGLQIARTFLQGFDDTYLEKWYSVAAVTFVDIKTASASSPRQYRRVLTCFLASSSNSPDALRNCSNHLFHLGQSSGFLKLKGSGGSKRSWAIVHRCYHVVFWSLLKTQYKDIQHRSLYYLTCY